MRPRARGALLVMPAVDELAPRDASRNDDTELVTGESLLEGVLALVRRETLVLAAAVRSSDQSATDLAAGRVRWLVGSALQFATLAPLEPQVNARLAQVVEAAEWWLPAKFEATTSTSPFEPVDASNLVLADLNLDRLPLLRLNLRYSTVAHLSAVGARVDGLDATAARIVLSRFHRASLRRSRLADAMIEDCDFSLANFEQSDWGSATVIRCNLAGVVLFDSRLEARFVDCNLRGADLQAYTRSVAGVGAEFIRCNLRDTTWTGRDLSCISLVDCQIDGALERQGGAEDGSRVGTRARGAR